MNKKATIKVTKNIYGNYRGFVTGKQSIELGAIEFDAKQWASDMLSELPYAVLSEKSYITQQDIEKFYEQINQ